MLASSDGFLTSTTETLTFLPLANFVNFLVISLIFALSCPKTEPGRAVKIETVTTSLTLSISTCDNNASFNLVVKYFLILTSSFNREAKSFLLASKPPPHKHASESTS